MSKTIIQEPKHEQRQIADGQSSVFMNEDFLFVSQMGVDDNDWANFHQPYLMGQSRMVKVLSGEARYVINLEEHTFRMGDVVILPKGSIVQVEEATEDYHIAVVSLSDRVRQSVNQLLHIQPSYDELRLISDYFNLIDESLRTTDYHASVMEGLVASLYRLARHIHQAQESLPDHQEDRRTEIFHRFLALVNANADTERNIDFYARDPCRLHRRQVALQPPHGRAVGPRRV